MFDDTNTDHDRRHFVGRSILSLAMAPLGCLVVPGPAQARGSVGISRPFTQIPRLPENDQQAAALSYREDAGATAATANPGQPGGSCRNCQLFSGAETDEWGPCAIFSYRQHPTLNRNFLVSAKGWCKSWGPRAT